MARFTSPLDRVRVAAPCNADWERMTGDERTRFCAQCELNVYNLSGMTRREAEALLTRAEGRLCVRFYRRSDGTILTRQCPVGLRALKARAGRAARAFLSAVLGFFGGLGFHGLAGDGRDAATQGQYATTGVLAVDDTKRPVRPTTMPRVEKIEPLMGVVAAVPKEKVERARPTQPERVQRTTHK